MLLEQIKDTIYDPSAIALTQLQFSTESSNYAACTFLLNSKKVIYRQAKITPTKSGQFVAIWNRNEHGITLPYCNQDDFDFLIITLLQNNLIGQFILPKFELVAKNIISDNKKVGKRGIRVYAPWDIVTSKQAIATKKWQSNFFYRLSPDDKDENQRISALFN